MFSSRYRTLLIVQAFLVAPVGSACAIGLISLLFLIARGAGALSLLLIGGAYSLYSGWVLLVSVIDSDSGMHATPFHVIVSGGGALVLGLAGMSLLSVNLLLQEIAPCLIGVWLLLPFLLWVQLLLVWWRPAPKQFSNATPRA